jgi:23S rRNA (pseudouridine1915-N3)-methyltransferase
VRIVVIAVGRLRAPYSDDVAHYAKLLSRYARLEQIELREMPTAADGSDRLAPRLPPRTFVSLLASDGERLDSLAFSDFIGERRSSGRDLAFVVGGAHGLELGSADHRLSLGPLTLPHQLARVVLLEQLYRAHKIIAGEPYHY